MSDNPYFNPNPVWMFITFKVWCVIGILSSLLASYMILFKSPPNQSPTFRRLIFYHILVGMLFELDLTVLSPPLIYLPYLAIKCPGLLSLIGVPLDVQLAILVHLIVCASSAVCPLFYYRMMCVIPPHHFLKNKLTESLVYICFYVLGVTLPIPLILLAINFKPQKVIKQEIFEVYKVVYDDFWEPDIMAVQVHGNPWAVMFAALIILCVGALVSLIFICTIIIYRTVENSKRMISAKDKKEHITVLLSLTPLLINMTCAASIICCLVVASVFGIPRADIINILFVAASSLFPLTCIAYVFSYKPYRRHILRLFKRQTQSPVKALTTRWSIPNAKK